MSPWFHVAGAHRRLLWEPYVQRVVDEVESLGPLRARWWAATAHVERRTVGEDWAIRLRLARDGLRGNVP